MDRTIAKMPPKQKPTLPTSATAANFTLSDARKACLDAAFDTDFVNKLIPLLDHDLDTLELRTEQTLFLSFEHAFKKTFQDARTRHRVYSNYFKPVVDKFGLHHLQSGTVDPTEFEHWYSSFKRAYTSTKTLEAVVHYFDPTLVQTLHRIASKSEDTLLLYKKYVSLGPHAEYQIMLAENNTLPVDIQSFTLQSAIDFCLSEKDNFSLSTHRITLLHARGYTGIDQLKQLEAQRTLKLSSLQDISKQTNIRIQHVREIDAHLEGVEHLETRTTNWISDKIAKFTHKRPIADIVFFVLQDTDKMDDIRDALPYTYLGVKKKDLFFARRPTDELARLFDDVLESYELELQSTSAWCDDRLKERELRVISLFEFMDEYLPTPNDDHDPIVRFTQTCTYQSVYDLVLAFGKTQNHDNTRKKSKTGEHHQSNQGVGNAIWFFRKLGCKCPCHTELGSLRTTVFTSQITNQSELLDWDKRRMCTQDEINKMTKWCADDGNVKDQLLVTLLQEVALRNSAICNLKLQDLLDDALVIPKHTCRVLEKGKKYREFVTSTTLKTLILRYVETFKDVIAPGKYVFSRNPDLSTKMGSSTLNQVLKRIGVKAGVTDVNIQAHTFRHTLVCTLMDEGNNMDLVSKFIGHASVDTTSKYYYIKNIDELAKQLNNPFTNPALTADEQADEELFATKEKTLLNTKLDASIQIIGYYRRMIDEANGLDTLRENLDEERDKIDRAMREITAADTTTEASSIAYRQDI